MDSYYLDGKNPVRCENREKEYAEWRKGIQRVGDTTINGVRISTVFLRLDHAMDGVDEKPVLFETVVFGGPMDQDMYRYYTWDEAERGHADVVKLVLDCFKNGVENEKGFEPKV